MIIDLTQPHPYRDWSIVAHEKVLHTDGREYSKITYEQDGNREEALSAVSLEQHLWNRINEAPTTRQLFVDAQNNLKEPFIARLPKITLLFLVCVASCGLGLFVEDFREHFYAACMGRVIHLKFHPQGNKIELPKGSNGSANFTTGALNIRLGDDDIIDCSTEDDIISTMVFELTNFQQCKRFDAVEDNQIIDADQYAEECEHIEYDGQHIHHRVIWQAIKTNNWNPAMDYYGDALKNEWRTFKDFWRERWDHPHADYYRNSWRRRYGVAVHA